MTELKWIFPPRKDGTGDYILKEEVEKAITRMKNNKSPGINEITSKMRLSHRPPPPSLQLDMEGGQDA